MLGDVRHVLVFGAVILVEVLRSRAQVESLAALRVWGPGIVLLGVMCKAVVKNFGGLVLGSKPDVCSNFDPGF